MMNNTLLTRLLSLSSALLLILALPAYSYIDTNHSKKKPVTCPIRHKDNLPTTPLNDAKINVPNLLCTLKTKQQPSNSTVISSNSPGEILVIDFLDINPLSIPDIIVPGTIIIGRDIDLDVGDKIDIDTHVGGSIDNDGNGIGIVVAVDEHTTLVDLINNDNNTVTNDMTTSTEVDNSGNTSTNIGSNTDVDSGDITVDSGTNLDPKKHHLHSNNEIILSSLLHFNSSNEKNKNQASLKVEKFGLSANVDMRSYLKNHYRDKKLKFNNQDQITVKENSKGLVIDSSTAAKLSPGKEIIIVEPTPNGLQQTKIDTKTNTKTVINGTDVTQEKISAESTAAIVAGSKSGKKSVSVEATSTTPSFTGVAAGTTVTTPAGGASANVNAVIPSSGSAASGAIGGATSAVGGILGH